MIEHSRVIEEYLLTLYKLNRAGETAKSVALAKRLDTSPPTVHATISRMQRDGLINVNKKKELILTNEGQKLPKTLPTVITCLSIFFAIHWVFPGMKYISTHTVWNTQ